MSQLLGYLCSDDNLTPIVAEEIRQQAWQRAQRPWAASGFGWVQDSRTLLRKQPSMGAPLDMLGLMADVPARALVGQMSADTNGGLDALNLQPFRFRKWVYAQTGDPPLFEKWGAQLLADMPDHLRRGVRGQSAAEVLFLSFYHHMTELRALGPGPAEPPLVAQALADMLTEVRKLAQENGHEGELNLNLVAATERMLIAARLAEPLHLRLFSGLEQPGEDPLFAGHRPRAIQHPHFRAAFLGSGLKPVEDSWREIPAETIVYVDQSWEPKQLAIFG